MRSFKIARQIGGHMELIDNLEQAIISAAQVFRVFLSLPCLWIKNVTVGQALLALIILACLFWLFWDLLRK